MHADDSRTVSVGWRNGTLGVSSVQGSIGRDKNVLETLVGDSCMKM